MGQRLIFGSIKGLVKMGIFANKYPQKKKKKKYYLPIKMKSSVNLLNIIIPIK